MELDDYLEKKKSLLEQTEDLDKQFNINKKIQDILEQASSLLATAENLSCYAKNNSFSFNPAYGMGGTLRDGEWYSSSASC